jgi:signal transduction histidine kinase
MNKGLKRSSLVFYLLTIYVLFQFFWWAFHIIQLEQSIRDLSLVGLSDQAEIIALQKGYLSKVYMVVGEGAVFAILLLIGVWRIQRFFIKEAALAGKERNFMLAVTHELKTPIATVRLLLQTLSRSGVSEDQAKKMKIEAINETHRLEHLVQNILLSTKLDELEMTDRSRLDLAQIIDQCVVKMRRIAGVGQTIESRIEGDVIFFGDAMMIESMLSNLIENAIKYSPEESSIDVEAAVLEGLVQIRVLDRGVGVIPPEREKIFEKFYRIGSEETRESKGTGLGLFIVKQIVNMHNGEVHALGREGGGSIFEVHLPKNK